MGNIPFMPPRRLFLLMSKNNNINFVKYHGCGNDFIIIAEQYPNATIKLLADRHFGIGCDQLFIVKAHDKYDAHIEIYNADGTLAEACGNGTRAVADYLFQRTQKKSLKILGPVGVLHCEILDNGSIAVNMGKPIFDAPLIPIIGNYDENGCIPIDIAQLPRPFGAQIGNPHAVFIVDDATKIDLANLGAMVESHPIFPKRTNVEFVSKISDNIYRLRVFERGVGITLACGSGVCAAFAVLHKQQMINNSCEFMLDGGKLLMRFNEYGEIIMTGPAIMTFKGVFTNA